MITKPSEWIRYVYQDIPADAGPCLVSIWNRQTKESIHLAPPNDDAGALVFDTTISSIVDAGRDAYYGVGLRRPQLLKSQRGKVSDIRGFPGLFLDIDFDLIPEPGQITSPHAAKNLPKSEIEALQILTCLPDPSAIVDSGYGWHVYWLFEQVQPVGYLDQTELGEASEQFQRKAIAHAATLGYHVDSTYSLDRVLRLPGTLNTKAGLAKPVVCLIDDGPRYRDVTTLLQISQIARDTSLPASDGSRGSRDHEIDPSLLLPRREIERAQNNEWVRDSLGKLQNPESLALMEKVLAGKSFAQAGDRDRTLQRVASILAYIAPDRSPSELAAEILGPSLEWFADVDTGKFTQADRLAWASEKIERAQEDARRERVVKERHDSALLDVLLNQARAAPRRDQRLGPAPGGAYSDAELQAFARQQGTNPQDFRKRWIIQKGSSFYVYVNGDYQLPLQNTELDVSLPRDLAPAVQQGYVQLTTLNAKGEPRNKTTKEILTDYCSVARTIVTRLDLGFSNYDESTQTFYEASCPIRPLDPVYSPEVDRWLTLLGGINAIAAGKLLDWIATVTMLTRQSSALYVQGKAGTGKTLLGLGLARLWHQGGATELVRVLGEWSADMARCPLIVADEQIPQSFRGQRTSAELRSLIGNSSRTLTRKYLNNSDLVGAVRLILSANNADMLVFEENLSQADLEAVSGRFLHIQPNPTAEAYLASIDTTGWVEDDVIAKHALWLRDHRTVILGKRFAVEGSAQEISKMLATRGGVAARVTEWLVRYICDPKTTNKSTAAQAGLVVFGGDRYLVNTNAIISFWDNYVKSSKVPSTAQVGNALRNLATGDQVRYGSKRFFDVDIDSITHWCEANLVGDTETIRAKIAQPLPILKGDES